MDWNFLIRPNNSPIDALCVSTDTRALSPGCVFFALHGASFDGNQFAQFALDNGARLAVVDDPEVVKDERYVLVKDTLLALQELARAWREELALPIIGITGTNGKTTTKELTAQVLSCKYRLHYTRGNLNNSIGVPLTLLQLRRDHEMAIVEMGASHIGDIRELVEIARPNYGLITNVGRAHLQGFGSFEGVMSTKAELYDYLREHKGLIFRNADNPYLSKMAGDMEAVLYHTGHMPEGTHLVGEYNSENIQAAVTVGRYFGVDEDEAMAAIRSYVPTNNRSQAMQTEHNRLVVDAYNANPTSMTAAIQSFSGDTYILGEMRELGDYAHLEHQNIVNLLLEHKATEVLLVGHEYAATTAPFPIFSDVNELITYLQAHPYEGRHILVKGSRGNQLEKIIPYL